MLKMCHTSRFRSGGNKGIGSSDATTLIQAWASDNKRVYERIGKQAFPRGAATVIKDIAILRNDKIEVVDKGNTNTLCQPIRNTEQIHDYNRGAVTVSLESSESDSS